MNLRKFVAPTSRAALKLLRDALGPDAVVLSTQQANGHCEILALPMGEADRLAKTQQGEARREPAAPHPAQAAKLAAVPLQSWAKERADPARRFCAVVDDAIDMDAPARVAAPAAIKARAAPPPAAPQPMLDELRQLRALIAAQGASLAWMESGHRRPLRAALMRELLCAGFSAWFARSLTERLPDDYDEARAHGWLREAVQRNLPCAASPDELLEGGGVIALVGPTGVGKTTTTAKLAARCVVRYGAQSVGLVSTDTYRIGAQDQLKIYGRILGVPVNVCHDAESLGATLAAHANKRAVLVDTVGMGQRDERVKEQGAMLQSCGARRVLLLNAAMQPDVLDEVAAAYGGEACAGAALTKLDEAVALGGAIEVAIRRRLALQFITNGQRVPEDLHAASAALLAHRAMRVSRKPWSPLDEEFGLLATAAMHPQPSEGAHA